MKTDISKPLALKTALKSQPERKPVEVSDTVVRGLSARVRKIDGQPIGKWNLRITIGGKTQRISLGDVSAMSGTEARTAALQAKADAVSGQAIQSASTAARKAQAQAEAKAQQAQIDGTTLAQLLYEDTKDRVSYQTLKWDKLKSGAGAARHVRSFLGPLAEKPAKLITKRDLEKRFLQKADSAPHSATRGLAYLRPALIHWMKRGFIERDVLDLVEDHKAPTTSRDRVLTPDEWVRIWNATDKLPAQASMAVRVLAMTGARNREVAAMRVEELHLDKNEWHLPTDRSKNSDPHIFALPDAAVAILRDAIEASTGPCVFSHDGETPVWLGSKIKNKLDAESGVTDWVFHDLRRSMATHMSEAGVPSETVDLMLNHRASASRGGVAGVYNRSLKLDDRHRAAARWDQITHRWQTGKEATVVKIG